MKFLNLSYLILLFISCWSCNSNNEDNITKSIQFDGQSVKYDIYLPAELKADVALLIGLHGSGHDSKRMAARSGFAAIADTSNVIVVFPNAQKKKNWNAGPVEFNTGADDVGMISKLIDELKTNHSINRVFVAGMSNGGFMAHRLACELSDKITGIASVTGSINPGIEKDCPAKKAISILQISGLADEIVPYEGNSYSMPNDRVISFWKTMYNCALSELTEDLKTCYPEQVKMNSYTGCSNNSRVVNIIVADGEHEWYCFTSELVWDFFSLHLE